MIEYVSDALLAALFPADTGGPGILRIAGPLQVDATIEASGIDFDGTRHLVFFADVMTYAGHDEQFVRETAAAWNGGFVPRRHGWSSSFAPRQTVRPCFTQANGHCRTPR
jgi:hypothetical protein